MSNAKKAYMAYAVAVGGKTWDNKPMPAFDDLPDRQREGWEAAVAAVVAQ